MTTGAGEQPELTVVVVCMNEPAILARCAESLETRAPQDAGEIILVGRWSEPNSEIGRLRERFPQFTWLDAGLERTVPEMRRLGIEKSHGRYVALIEDDCVIGPAWWDRGRLEEAGSHCAVGGPIEPGEYRSAVSWAVFFCEFARFMSPFGPGEVPRLAGTNVVYPRDILLELVAGTEGGYYELPAHSALRKRGGRLVAHPEMRVENANQWSVRHVTSVPFQHGRGFAAMRAAGAYWPARVLWGAAAASLLPLLMVTRVAREVFGRRRYVRQLVAACPWVVSFAVSWSSGEVVGYLFGPGNSLRAWR